MSDLLGVLIFVGVIAFPGIVTCVLYLLLKGWMRKVALSLVLLLPIALLALTCIPPPPPADGMEGKGMIIMAFQALAFITFFSMMPGLAVGWSRQKYGRPSGQMA